MKIYNVEQGSVEWMEMRAGIPTASEFHRFITPAKLERSKSAGKYMARLLAERITGRPIEEVDGADYQSEWMKRGSDIEAQAVKAYEFEYEVDTRIVGFCTTDDGRVGASPDRLVGDDGGLEMKGPSLAIHVEYLLNPQLLVDKYRLQVYGQLLVGEGVLKWVDLVSYHPFMPLVRVRLGPREDVMKPITASVAQFCDEADSAYLRLVNEHGPFSRPRPAQDVIPGGLTDEDEELIVTGLKAQGKL